MITEFLDKIDSVMYYPILIIVMSLAGIYFTVLTKEGTDPVVSGSVAIIERTGGG